MDQKIYTAEEARKKTEEYFNSDVELLEVMGKIEKAIERGLQSVDIQDGIVGYTESKLQELGYEVRTNYEGSRTYISW